uniref:Uncharacterized protein n=1 Tax=Cacopsylla melanoneura TaxID=428564 RepID=A0A8D9EU73_9HEMI
MNNTAITQPIEDVNNVPIEFDIFGCKFVNGRYETIKTITPIWEDKPSGRIRVCISRISESDQLVSMSSKNREEKVSAVTKEEITGAPKNNTVNSKRTNEQMVLYTYQWDQFKHELRQTFVETLKTHTLNDVDPFIRFIEAYNTQMAKAKKQIEFFEQNMESFLNGYKVPFHSKENPAGLIIDLFHEMQRRSSDDLEPYFLVTAYIDPPRQNVRKIKEGYEELTKTRFQEHVAGNVFFVQHNSGPQR